MKKTVLTFGLISGLVVSGLMLATIPFFHDDEFSAKGMLIGYSTMLIAFSMVYVGIKNYRDKHSHGYISFLKGLQIGMLITLIASTTYVVTWEIYSSLYMPDFMDKYVAASLKNLKASGASAVEIQKQTEEMEQAKEMYKNPMINVLMVYMEIIPVGVLISLISALILKRKPKLDVVA